MWRGAGGRRFPHRSSVGVGSRGSAARGAPGLPAPPLTGRPRGGGSACRRFVALPGVPSVGAAASWLASPQRLRRRPLRAIGAVRVVAVAAPHAATWRSSAASGVVAPSSRPGRPKTGARVPKASAAWLRPVRLPAAAGVTGTSGRAGAGAGAVRRLGADSLTSPTLYHGGARAAMGPFFSQKNIPQSRWNISLQQKHRLVECRGERPAFIRLGSVHTMASDRRE